MSDDMFSVGHWLTEMAASAPELVALVVGLVICYRQRQRRPRVANLLGWALLAALIWLAIRVPIDTAMLVWLAPAAEGATIHEANMTAWLQFFAVYGLVVSTIHAAIWGTVLWAVLKVDDWQGESVRV
ncbi:MAG: hypothetical protein AABP62_05105 [Planctomycetota bacterium]